MECGIDSKGNAHPYEFSARFGWPSTQIAFACHTGDPVNWMKAAVATGDDKLEVDDRVAIGVLMCRPPFPTKNEDPQSNVGYPIAGVEDVWDHVSPWQMMLAAGAVMDGDRPGKGEVYKTTGEYIWEPPATLGGPATLMNFPLVEAEDMPDIAADSFSIAFGDFNRGYLVVDRLGVRVLRDPYSAKPYVLFYTTKRVGGGMQDFEAIKLLKFGTT